MLHARIEGGHLTVTYSVAKAAVDVSLELEQSEDLMSWQGGMNHIEITDTVDNGTLQQITARSVAPVDAANASFIRLKVVRR